MVSAISVLCYVGPGGLLSAFGTFVALLGAVVLAVVGFVWYPIRRLLRALRRREPDAAPPPRSSEP